MRTAGVHHVDLVVSSIERSLPFYRDLLAPLGYHRISEVGGERGETIWYFGGPDVSIGLRQAQAGDGVDRYRVGLHHLALDAFAHCAAMELDPYETARSARKHRAAAAHPRRDGRVRRLRRERRTGV